MNTIFRNDTS